MKDREQIGLESLFKNIYYLNRIIQGPCCLQSNRKNDSSGTGLEA
jgi:hypothetical protein